MQNKEKSPVCKLCRSDAFAFALHTPRSLVVARPNHAMDFHLFTIKKFQLSNPRWIPPPRLVSHVASPCSAPFPKSIDLTAPNPDHTSELFRINADFAVMHFAFVPCYNSWLTGERKTFGDRNVLSWIRIKHEREQGGAQNENATILSRKFRSWC